MIDKRFFKHPALLLFYLNFKLSKLSLYKIFNLHQICYLIKWDSFFFF